MYTLTSKLLILILIQIVNMQVSAKSLQKPSFVRKKAEKEKRKPKLCLKPFINTFALTTCMLPDQLCLHLGGTWPTVTMLT